MLTSSTRRVTMTADDLEAATAITEAAIAIDECYHDDIARLERQVFACLTPEGRQAYNNLHLLYTRRTEEKVHTAFCLGRRRA